MKRWMAWLLLLCALFQLAGCQRRRDCPEDLFMTLISVLEEEGRTELYTSKGERSERNEALVRIYGREDAPEAFSSVSSYGIALSQRDDGYELHMLVARHQSDEQTVRGLLRGRIDLVQSADVKDYLKSGYESYIASARLYSKGRYHFLLVTGDNDRVIDKIGEIF